MNKKRVRGIISVTRRGVGYVTPESADTVDDIEVAPEHLGTALNRDVVEVNILPKRGRGRLQGEVARVIERARTRFVGTLHRDQKNRWYLSPDDPRVHIDFAIRPASGGSNDADKRSPRDALGVGAAEHTTYGAAGASRASLLSTSRRNLREGHKALVEMRPWNNPNQSPGGVVIKILGKAGAPQTERDAVVFAHDFDTEFPKAVRDEAATIARQVRITEHDTAGRRDFRDVPTMTIDPEDARDFDDALSVRTLEGGVVEVGIHIADVSHYVRPRSAIDREAIERGTSVYLVGETIPMLPEALSNDLCSLNPNEDKLAFSAVFTLSKDGAVVDRWFGRTIIRSDTRFTYEEAQGVINAKRGPHKDELLILDTLAKQIRKMRFKSGAIDFDTDEVVIETDATGLPSVIRKKTRLDAHRLIEEWMLLANRAVAEFVYKKTKQKSGPPPMFVYRVHDTPDRDKLEELSVFLRAIGYDLARKGKEVTSRDLNALFRQIEGRPEEHLIKIATVRTMAKAIYTTKNIGHFGLAFRYYTHFTSPIRRYPDIMVHRLLLEVLEGKPITKREFAHYEKLALRGSEREIAAVEAERESIKWAQVVFFKDRVGKEFDAVVSGVTSWGLYVAEVNTMAEGLVRFASLKDDYYSLDQKNYSIVGEKTKKRIALGDPLRVRLTAADPETKTLDFELVR